MEITFEVARLGESLSRRHTRHGEKISLGTLTPSSASAQQLSAMTLPQLRETQRVKMQRKFVLLPDSKA